MALENVLLSLARTLARRLQAARTPHEGTRPPDRDRALPRTRSSGTARTRLGTGILDVVDQIAVLGRHEMQIARVAGGDDRLAERHGLGHGQAQALPTGAATRSSRTRRGARSSPRRCSSCRRSTRRRRLPTAARSRSSSASRSSPLMLLRTSTGPSSGAKGLRERLDERRADSCARRCSESRRRRET